MRSRGHLRKRAAERAPTRSGGGAGHVEPDMVESYDRVVAQPEVLRLTRHGWLERGEGSAFDAPIP
jgi:hypothetical protein